MRRHWRFNLWLFCLVCFVPPGPSMAASIAPAQDEEHGLRLASSQDQVDTLEAPFGRSDDAVAALISGIFASNSPECRLPRQAGEAAETKPALAKVEQSTVAQIFLCLAEPCHDFTDCVQPGCSCSFGICQ